MTEPTIGRFAVGEPWPLPVPPGEGLRPILDQASLSFLFLMPGIQDGEAAAFRKGALEYGLFRDNSIPFVLFSFKGFGTFDCYINTFVEPQAKLDAFMGEEPNANLWQLFLVDSRSMILHGIRATGVEPSIMHDIKSECFRQAEVYSSSSALIVAAQRILASYTTKQLIQRARMLRLRAHTE